MAHSTAWSSEPTGAEVVGEHAAGEQLSTPRGIHCTAFWFAFWLGVVLVATKAVHLGMPELTMDGIFAYFYDLTVISNSDIVYAFAVGLAAQLAFLLAPQSVVWRAVIWAVLILFCVISVVYAVISVQVFSYLRSPLTYPLLYLAGDVKNMRSSVTAFASVSLVTALFAVPLGYLIAACASHRFIQPARTSWFRFSQFFCLAAMTGIVLYGRVSFGGVWSDRNDRRIAENPHWTLFTSCVTELLGDGSLVQLDEVFPEDYLDEFRVVQERPQAVPADAALEHRPRNVIVLVMESTSARYLDIYNSPFKDVTPCLSAEAAHSLIFDNFYCHVGLTANAVVAISLSLYPGMTWREYTIEHPRLPGRTVADELAPLGYRTAFIHNGDLEYVGQGEFLSNRGFDTVWDYRSLDGGTPDPDGFSWGIDDRHLIDGIFKWIDQDRDRPFFLLTWTIQAHHPYTIPVQNKKDFFQENTPPGDDYSLDLYLNAVHESDREIGRLLDGLRQRGLADDTLVVITGDHGEAFGHPHDTYGHGAKLYQENVNIPLILWNPKMFRGERSSVVGSQIDLNPTIMHLLGLAPSQAWQGHSLFANDRPSRAYFYAANDDYLLGVREQRWKYVYNATTGREMLFDLDADPDEQTNVSQQQREVCDDLRKRLAAWLKYEQRLLERLHGEGAK